MYRLAFKPVLPARRFRDAWLCWWAGLLLLGSLPATTIGAETTAPGHTFALEQVMATHPIARDWRFRQGDDPAWAAPTYDDTDWDETDLPERRWSRDTSTEPAFIWYRMHIHFELDSKAEREQLAHLGISVGKVLSAYELYAGGELIGGLGTLPPAGDTSVDYDRQNIYPLPLSAISEDGDLVLALRVWGGDEVLRDYWGTGPYAGAFKLGPFGDLLLKSVLAQLPGLLISVSSVLFGLYHLYLYSKNHQLQSFLWFGLLAVAMGVYALMLNEWRHLLPWSALTFKKVEFGAIYLVPPLAMQMVWSLLDEPINRWLRCYQICFVVLAVTLVAIPGLNIHVVTLTAWQAITLPALLMTTGLALLRWRDGHEEARTIALGAILFVVASLHDIAADQMRDDAVQFLPYGFLAVLVSMGVSLGNRFTAMLNGLEKEVAERTAKLSAANELLAERARIDPLTGLYNRRGLVAQMEAEIRRTQRYTGGFTVVLADVDHFKSVNDHYGHACGDQVLGSVANILRDSVREVDHVARWGGEEFLLFLPGTDSDGAAVLAEKIRTLIAGHTFLCDEQELRLTMTFGISTFARDGSFDSCIARADSALYRGKHAGRNRVVVSGEHGAALSNLPA